MSNTSKSILEYTRDAWTAQDILDLANAIIAGSIPVGSKVKLTAASPQSGAGTIEVQN